MPFGAVITLVVMILGIGAAITIPLWMDKTEAFIKKAFGKS